jgi:hypothetical protein
MQILVNGSERSTPTVVPGASGTASPNNEDFQAALRVEIDELLASDAAFRRRVEQKLDQLGITHVEQRGDQSVMAVGRVHQTLRVTSH